MKDKPGGKLGLLFSVQQQLQNRFPSLARVRLAVHRVVTKCLDHRGQWIVEAGPWLVSHDDAENWASQLREMGYQAKVDSINGGIAGGGDNFDLQNALASMA